MEVSITEEQFDRFCETGLTKHRSLLHGPQAESRMRQSDTTAISLALDEAPRSGRTAAGGRGFPDIQSNAASWHLIHRTFHRYPGWWPESLRLPQPDLRMSKHNAEICRVVAGDETEGVTNLAKAVVIRGLHWYRFAPFVEGLASSSAR